MFTFVMKITTKIKIILIVSDNVAEEKKKLCS